MACRITRLLILGCVVFGKSAIGLAQIIPDATLGPEASRLQQNGVTDQIEGGAVRGTNLFHSFEAFNVGEGRQVYFGNPAGIEHIVSRVTGNSRSDIMGTLGVLGAADLFLLNPNGIVFGPNAQLDVNGSFLASTGDRILFPEGAEFSAVNPQAPPLLTIRAPIGLQYGANPGAIRVEGPGNNLRVDPTSNLVSREDRPSGLQISPGSTLALVGGDISLAGGNLTVDSGRIELGGVGSQSLVSFSPDAQGWRLGYEGASNFRNVELAQSASVDASGEGGGVIRVRGETLSLTEGSAILAGTLGPASAASLILETEQSIELRGANANALPSILEIDVRPGATGNAGFLTITTGRLILQDGAFVSSSTQGRGNGGALTIQTTESVELSGENSQGFSSSLETRVGSQASGNAGTLAITTGRLILQDGALVSSSTQGRGDGGALTIQAAESVELSGMDGQGFSSTLVSGVGIQASGDAGALTIITGRLILQDGAVVSSTTLGRGDAGALTIQTAESVELSGVSSQGFSSTLQTAVDFRASGDAGALTLTTGRLILQDGAFVSSATFGQGDGGSLTVQAAESAELSGEDSWGFSSTLQTAVGLPPASGDAGALTLTTERLILQDGAFVSSATFGQGDGGRLTIQATESIELSGKNSQGFQSELETEVGFSASGNAGALTITTGRLALLDEARILSQTQGKGDAGDLRVAADVALVADGGVISAQTTGQGTVGKLTVFADHLIVRDGGQLLVRGQGAYPAGTMTLIADRILLINQARLSAETETGDQGDIVIQTQDLLLRGGSRITTDATDDATGGDITIAADGSLLLLDDSAIVARAEGGPGGNIRITAQGLFQSRDSRIDASSQLGIDGLVDINTPEIDPTQGAMDLPETLVDPQLDQRCHAGGDSSISRFVNSGRGGLPPSPEGPLSSSNSIWEDVRPPTPAADSPAEKSTAPAALDSAPIVEAQGWRLNQQGQVVLAADVANAQSQRLCGG